MGENSTNNLEFLDGVLLSTSDFAENSLTQTTTTATTSVAVVQVPIVMLMQIASGTFIILVNSATIAAFLATRDEPGNKGNVLVASLAMTDILVGLALYAESASWIFSLVRNDKSHCLARSVWLHVCLAASMLHILAIAADRYLYIVWPFLYQRAMTSRKCGIVIVILWLISFALGSLPLFVNQYEVHRVCDLVRFMPRRFLVIFAPAFCYGCLIGTLIFYLMIARLAWEKLRSGVARPVPETPMATLRMKLRAMRQSLVVFLAFFLFISPHFIVYIVNDFITISHGNRVLCSTVAYINSGINFFVYMTLNKDFRGKVCEWLGRICCCFCCCRGRSAVRSDSTQQSTIATLSKTA